MSEFINSDNVERLAKLCYVNAIYDEAEFWEDYDRIKYVKRLFNRFRETGNLKTNLVVNHLIVLFNVFETTDLLRILFYKFDGYHPYLKPFLVLLQRCPDKIQRYNESQPILHLNDIADDPDIVEALRANVLFYE